MDQVASKVDDLLAALEAQVVKHVHDGAFGKSFVTREKTEIDFLKMVERVRDILLQITKDDNREILVRTFGEPFVRLARLRYLLENVPLSDKRSGDQRWKNLGACCDIVESVFRDLGSFRDWHELQQSGAFKPAFADGSIGVVMVEDAAHQQHDLGEAEEVEPSQPKWSELSRLPDGAYGDDGVWYSAEEWASHVYEEFLVEEFAEYEAMRLADEEARKRKEEEERLRAEEEARRLAEEEARRKAEEERRRLAEEARRRAEEEEARRKAEEEEWRLAEEEAMWWAEEESRRWHEEEKRRKAEEARRRAEEEERRRAEEEAKRRAEEDAMRQAEEESRRWAEAEEEWRLAEIDAMWWAEEESRSWLEEEKRRKAEEEARRRAEEEERRRAEEEARRRAEEEARRRAEAEERRRAEEEARIRAEEEARRRAEEEERRKAEEEARRRAAEEARKKEEERKRAEEEAKTRAEEEARRRAEEARRKAEEEERRKAEDEARRMAAEEARQRAVEEEERRRVEEEARRKSEEEARLKAEEEERKRLEAELEAAKFRAKPLGFCERLKGRSARLLEGGAVVTRTGDTEEDIWGSLLDGIGGIARAGGISTSGGRAALYHVRKKLANVPDDGGTVISDLPMQKFKGLGQYAEILVLTTNPSGAQGCVGIGVTRLSPDSWPQSCVFPKRLETFPAPSWIFSGPYRGLTSKLYLDGEKGMRFNVFDPDDPEAQWQPGDRIGVLLEREGRISLIVNGRRIVRAKSKGLSTDLETTDFWLVVEAFGYVTSVALALEPDAVSVVYGLT